MGASSNEERRRERRERREREKKEKKEREASAGAAEERSVTSPMSGRGDRERSGRGRRTSK